jgi:CelD/BcsL family acetyltransferase involved in cellulose biosynthesis
MARALELVDARDPRVESAWRSLESQAHPPFFLSWGWIENWLASLPVDRTPALALVRDDAEPVAAFFLGRRRLRRNLVLTSNAFYFNATGSDRHDEVCIEHNGMLAAPTATRTLADLLALLPDEWDELYLPALDRYAFDDLGAPTFAVHVDREVAAPFVDLDAVRGLHGGYANLLDTSTRSHLRRMHRLLGDPEVEVATDQRHAMDIYGELLRLHARRWAARGKRGAFADPWFERFHRRLITARLPHGEIQLVRIRANNATLGCLYNFVYRGRVLFYQCGLAHFDDPHIQPGVVCHAAAIEHNAGAGNAVYDLLGSTARYKHQLATGANRILWLRVQRPHITFSIENRLRALKHAFLPRRLALGAG